MSSYLPYKIQAEMNTLNLTEMTIWGQLWWSTGCNEVFKAERSKMDSSVIHSNFHF